MIKNKKIVLIDNYDSFTYNLYHYIESFPDCEVDVFRNDKISINAIAKYDYIILSPGPGLPIDAGISKEVIKKYATHKKILGVCLGMQAIGEVFGAKLKNLQTVFHGVSTSIEVLKKEDVIFKGIPTMINVGRYHSWVVDVDDFPNDLIITSIDEFGNPMSLSHSNHLVFGVQFHPESVLTQYGKEILKNFLSL